MRISFHARLLLTGMATVAIATGCSGGASQAVSPMGPLAHQQSASSSLERVVPMTLAHPLSSASTFSPGNDTLGAAAVYVSDFLAGTVTVISTAGTQTAQVTGFNYPKGLTGDSLGNVYIVDQRASAVYRYSAGLKTLGLTIPVTGYYPTDVAVSTSGVVGVTSGTSTAGGAGAATFYAKNATTPCATITDPNWTRMYFGSFDDSGALYVGGRDINANVILGVIHGGCSAKKITTLTGASIGYIGGIQIASNDNILIDDQTTSTVYSYKPPVNNVFAAPVATTTLSGAGDAVFISLNRTSTDIYDTDASFAYVQEFAYPSGGAAIKTFMATGAQSVGGVYVSPNVQP
ncbi:MAG: hypothetical protein M3M96_07120 [Candidatus Eremiobacteraeota bacterium]|nr:hypothetical protein [Candidatus Eremiobacteraeota bacterium]